MLFFLEILTAHFLKLTYQLYFFKSAILFMTIELEQNFSLQALAMLYIYMLLKSMLLMKNGGQFSLFFLDVRNKIEDEIHVKIFTDNLLTI